MKNYLLLYSADFGLMVILPRVSRRAVGTSCVYRMVVPMSLWHIDCCTALAAVARGAFLSFKLTSAPFTNFFDSNVRCFHFWTVYFATHRADYVSLRISLFTGIHTRKERHVPSEDAQQIWFKNGVNNRWKRFPPTKTVTFGYEKRRSDWTPWHLFVIVVDCG